MNNKYGDTRYMQGEWIVGKKEWIVYLKRPIAGQEWIRKNEVQVNFKTTWHAGVAYF